jgi:hypothetical protein
MILVAFMPTATILVLSQVSIFSESTILFLSKLFILPQMGLDTI